MSLGGKGKSRKASRLSQGTMLPSLPPLPLPIRACRALTSGLMMSAVLPVTSAGICRGEGGGSGGSTWFEGSCTQQRRQQGWVEAGRRGLWCRQGYDAVYGEPAEQQAHPCLGGEQQRRCRALSAVQVALRSVQGGRLPGGPPCRRYRLLACMQSDLPAPVAMTSRVSRPSNELCITSSCGPRNSV